MSDNKKYCYNCEVELNAENTSEFDGFDGSNHLSAKSVGLDIPADFFTKCDGCFNADIDRHLDNQYN